MEDSIFDVEQLVVAVKLTSAQNEVALVQSTAGVIPADRDEVLAHARRVKLFNGRFESSNLFSFRLPSGASAVGRLIPQRGKPCNSGEFFFHCLVATPEVFYHCGSDPVRLALHAMSTTFFSAYRPGDTLQRFKLEEPISCANFSEVRRASDKIGVHTFAVLLQSLFQYEQTYFVADYHAFLLISNVFSLLPVFARRELSFSVGLFFSDDSSFNFVGVTLPKRVPFRCRETLEAESFLDLRDVAENGSEYPVDAPWAKLVEDVLTRDLGDSFFYRIAKSFLEEEPPLERTGDLRVLLEEVDELSEEWREFLESDDVDKIEGFEGFAARFTDGEEDEFGALNGWRDDDDSDGEEWKQGNDYDSFGYDNFSIEEGVDDEDDEQEDGALHKVQFVEIPGNFENDAQSFPSEQNEDAEPVEVDVFESLNGSCPGVADVVKFLETRLTRRKRDEASERADGGIRLAPFVVLSAEFPEQNVPLRRLDALIFCALSGNVLAKREFEGVWKDFCETSNEETTKRVREVYFQNLLAAVKKEEGFASFAREEQLKNIFELAKIMAE